jgi:formate dehydrogenase major subunit
LGTSFGRGGATTFQQDLQNADCIVIEGSNMAECHPVGFQWVMEAKARGATVIHVDPRYTRTSAVADMHVPLRAGTDIAFLGGIINYVLANDKYFREYVLNYTNAATLVTEDFADTEDLDGLFSGFDPEGRGYDERTWQYRGTEVQAAAGERDELYEERRARRHAADRPDPAGPALRLPDPQAALRPLHAGDGGADLRRAAGGLPPGLRVRDGELRPGPDHRIRL